MNHPEAVLATGRCEIARRLRSLPGVITAHTVALPRESLIAPDAMDGLLDRGFAFPLLLRTPGCHQGENFLRVESIDELPAALDALPGSELLVIQYLDARGRDGKSRKYRVMMIDGQLYPLHAAISHHWKIHYFSAEMAESAEHRAEDREFLENMTGVIGDRAVGALQAIQTELGLDYGGIDFGLNEAGEVLVFEANATMAVIPPAADSRWDYRRPAVARVCEAVHAMIDRRAQRVRNEMAVMA
jgi:glutathione synthase/RimK-type ligase-like ATP-grasp enzyme